MSSETSEKETVGIIKTARNKKIIELLKKQNKNVVEFPEIKTVKNELDEIEKRVLENLERFDWLIFSDVFAVEYFLEYLEETDFDFFQLDEFKICACGESVSDKLRFSQIHSDVVPHFNSIDSIIDGIKEYIFDDDEFKNSKFLIIVAENKRENISKAFLENNLNAEIIKVYSIEKENLFSTAKYKSLISGGAIDRFIFASPEDWESFSLIIDENTPLNEIEFETTDEITAQTLRENSQAETRPSGSV